MTLDSECFLIYAAYLLTGRAVVSHPSRGLIMKCNRNKNRRVKQYLGSTDQVKTQQRFDEIGLLSGVVSVVQTAEGADMYINVPRPSSLARFFDEHQTEISSAIAYDSLQWNTLRQRQGKPISWRPKRGGDNQLCWTLRRYLSLRDLPPPPELGGRPAFLRGQPAPAPQADTPKPDIKQETPTTSD